MEPTIDPKTGQPIQAPPPTNPPATPPDPNAPPPTGQQFVQVEKGEWDSIKQRLDSFEAGVRFGQGTAQPAAPAAPQGPSFADQIKDIDTQIESLNGKIDEAVSAGKPVSKLMTDRDNLTQKRLRMQIKHEDIDPAFNAGIQTIDQLSAEVTKGKMPYLTIPEVKQGFDAALKDLSPDQRMNPAIRQKVYSMIVGDNIDKITEAEKEKALRSVSEPPVEPPGGNSRSTGAPGTDTIPKPEEFLSKESLAAIQMKGISIDDYFRRMGHAEGYEGWYRKYHMPKKEE